MRTTTIARIILVMLLWASCFPFIGIGIQYSPHLSFAALRAVIAGLMLTFLALALRQTLPREPSIWAILVGVGLGATSLGFLGMFHAAEFVSPGVATVIANTQPLLAAVMASFILGEKLTSRGKIGLALGFVGILVITAPHFFSGGQENYILGVGYITLSAIGITISNVLIKRIAGKVDALMAMGLQMLVGSIPLILGAWVTENPFAIQWSLPFVSALLILSLLGSALVYWLWFSILETTALNRANAFSFLVPIFGLSIGVLFYGETLGLLEFSGIALTIFGVGLVIARENNSKPQSA